MHTRGRVSHFMGLVCPPPALYRTQSNPLTRRCTHTHNTSPHTCVQGLRGGAVHSFEARNGLGRGGLLTKYAKLDRKSRSAQERLGRDSVFRKSGASVLNMRLEL